MILRSSREIDSWKFFKKLAGPPVYYIGSNEPSHAPKLDRPDNTLSRCKWFYVLLVRLYN
jgi:hypothetical protein